jgi:hypothetical protein
VGCWWGLLRVGLGCNYMGVVDEVGFVMGRVWF